MRTVVLMIMILSLEAKGQTISGDRFFVASPAGTSELPGSPQLTGVLSNDLLYAVKPASDSQDSVALIETRSAFKAGAFSLLVPGAGQLYNGNYVKAAAFFAVEVAGWVVNAMWTQKGNNQTTYFQNYADGTANYVLNGQKDPYGNGHYSVVRYVQWIQTNWQQLLVLGGHDPSDNTDPSVRTLQQYEPTMLINNGTPAPWSKVDWYSLNQVESALNGYFTHLLPPHGDQQYYELIGKYPQFRQGWDDSPYAKGNTTFTDFMDYSTTNSGYYMNQRGQANSLYSVASTAVGVVLVNHFVSAIEAAIWAHNHNKEIQAHVSMSKLPDGFGYQTELHLAVNF
jgi:hypothetical protein